MYKQSNILTFLVTQEHQGITLKEVLYDKMKLSSRLVRKLKRGKNILVNENRIPFHAQLRKGDCVKVVMPQERNQFEPEDIPLDIVYEDEDLFIVNKQPGIVVHPTKGHPVGTLANAIVYHMEQTNEHFKIRFINRLDRDTSGLVMIAKNPFAQQELSKQMQQNQTKKMYLTVVKGNIDPLKGTIDAPIGRVNEEDIKRAVHEGGQPSITHYEVLENLKDASLVKVLLQTGRTHQIRVHMNHIHHPLIGDTLYGYVDENLIKRQALHASSLEFNQPRSGKRVFVKACMPKDMEILIEKLKKDS